MNYLRRHLKFQKGSHLSLNLIKRNAAKTRVSGHSSSFKGFHGFARHAHA